MRHHSTFSDVDVDLLAQADLGGCFFLLRLLIFTAGLAGPGFLGLRSFVQLFLLLLQLK